MIPFYKNDKIIVYGHVCVLTCTLQEVLIIDKIAHARIANRQNLTCKNGVSVLGCNTGMPSRACRDYLGLTRLSWVMKRGHEFLMHGLLLHGLSGVLVPNNVQ